MDHSLVVLKLKAVLSFFETQYGYLVWSVVVVDFVALRSLLECLVGVWGRTNG